VRIFFHYCLPGFTNCYCIAPNKDQPRSDEALLIDPGSMDKDLLNLIEQHNFRLRGVLLTHSHEHHTQGLKTLRKIYQVPVYAVKEQIADTMVHDGEQLEVGPFIVRIMLVPGHAADCAAYLIENIIFTGDALTAGLTGSTISPYGAKLQMAALQSKLFSLPDEIVLMPGHGPPSTVESERRFNTANTLYEKSRN
jgi:glyoxylase-like metal-dependent hydrolase (beta-lactamase superfamily II)